MERTYVCAREGRDLGQIESYMGRWIWPFREMQEGDWFTVLPDDKPIGGVRAAANAAGYRLGKKFSIVNDNGMIRCTAVPMNSTLTAADANEDRVRLTEGDGELYLGVLEPPADGGRWSWPFKSMEPGQYFHVRHEDRHPELVRQLAHVRAGTQGYSISVRRDDPTRPGHARVEYADRTKEAGNRDLEYAGVEQILQRYYGHSMDHFNFWGLMEKVGSTQFFSCPQIAKPRFDKYLAHLIGMTDFVFEFREDGVQVTSIEKGLRWALIEKETDVDPFS